MVRTGSERILSDVLGRDPSVEAVQAMSADDFLELDHGLAGFYKAWTPVPAADDSFRAFVPLGLPENTWAFEAGLLFANSVTVCDPIDGVFLGDGLVSFVAGLGLGLEHRGEFSEGALEELRVSFLANVARTDEGLRVLRSSLAAALQFLDVWRDPIEAQIIHLTPFRTTIEVGMKVAHLAKNREGLLPEAFGQYVGEGFANPGHSVHHEVRDAWPLANLRFAHAQQSGSRLVPTDPYEWTYLRAALESVDAVARDRALVDGKAALGLASAISNLVIPLGVDPITALRIRQGSDEFQSWQAALRGAIRRIPEEAEPGTADFAGAAANVIQEELQPRIRAIERSGWQQRVKGSVPREVATLSIGAVGLGGLSQFLAVPPTAFAALPVAMMARLAAAAAFGERTDGESTVLMRLVKTR